jgi:hypothetical protein
MKRKEVISSILTLAAPEIQLTPIHSEDPIDPTDTTIHTNIEGDKSKSESPGDGVDSVPREKTDLGAQMELLAKYMSYETVHTEKDFADCFKSFLQSQFTTELWTFCEKVREWKFLKSCSFPNNNPNDHNYDSNNMDNNGNRNHGGTYSTGDSTSEHKCSTTYALQESIIQKYLQMNSNDELNVSKKIKDEVIDCHETMGDNAPLTLFDQVLLNVQEQLSTEKFPAFVKSNLFYSFIERKQGNVEMKEPEMQTATPKLTTPKSPNHALKRFSLKVTGLFFSDQEQSNNNKSAYSSDSDKGSSYSQKTKHLSVNHSIQKSFSLDEREFEQFFNNQVTKSTAKVYKSLPANRSYSIADIDKPTEKKKRNKFLSFFMKQRK